MAKGGARKALIGGTVVTLIVIGVGIFLAIWFTRKTGGSAPPGQLCSASTWGLSPVTGADGSIAFHNAGISLGCDYYPSSGDYNSQISAYVDSSYGKVNLTTSDCTRTDARTYQCTFSGKASNAIPSGSLYVTAFGFKAPPQRFGGL